MLGEGRRQKEAKEQEGAGMGGGLGFRSLIEMVDAVGWGEIGTGGGKVETRVGPH